MILGNLYLLVNSQTSKNKAQKSCASCHGTGRTTTFSKSATCFSCSGMGFVYGPTKCSVCKEATTRTTLRIQIKKGVRHNQCLTYLNHGNYLPNRKSRGDLLVLLTVEEEYGIYKRQGNDLHATLHISLRDAIMGMQLNDCFQHLDGRRLLIRQSSGVVISPDTTIIQKNEGMPIQDVNNKKGDLHITFKVTFPATVQLPQSRYDIDCLNRMFESDAERRVREENMAKKVGKDLSPDEERANLQELLSDALAILRHKDSNEGQSEREKEKQKKAKEEQDIKLETEQKRKEEQEQERRIMVEKEQQIQEMKEKLIKMEQQIKIEQDMRLKVEQEKQIREEVSRQIFAEMERQRKAEELFQQRRLEEMARYDIYKRKRCIDPESDEPGQKRQK